MVELARLVSPEPTPEARGLILRAASARAERLAEPATLGELSRLAEHCRGRSPRELVLLASVLEADGLVQRFTASCGPTVIQMIVCESDPVRAFEIHQDGLRSDDTEDAAGRWQRGLLEAFGGRAIGRPELQIRSRVRSAIGRLKALGEIGAMEYRAIRGYADGMHPLNPRGQRALAKLRARFDGFPAPSDLERLKRAGPLPSSDLGWSGKTMVEALAAHVTPVTGVRYEQTSPREGFARGQAWRHLDRASRVLRQGIEVPFGTQEPAHFMLLTRVRGQKPRREFLVSDPDSGRTVWIGERSLVKGAFIEEVFDLSRSGERGYIDSFFLPLEP